MLTDLFLTNTELPKDLIHIIVDYTECNCIPGYHKILKIQRNKCKYCKQFSTTMTSHARNCDYCSRLLRFKDKKCVICHQCLIKEQRVMKCIDCDDLIVKFGD